MKRTSLHLSFYLLAAMVLTVAEAVVAVASSQDRESQGAVLQKRPAKLVDDALPRIQRAQGENAVLELRQLQSDLRANYHKGEYADRETRKKLTSAILEQRSAMRAGDPAREQFDIEAVAILLTAGDETQTRNFVFDILDSGSERVRDSALIHMGAKSCAIPATALWGKIEELHRSGKLDQQRRLYTLERLDKERARPVVAEAIKAAQSKDDLLVVARVSEGFEDSTLTNELLKRAPNFGLDKPGGYDNGLRWIDNQSVARLLAVAKGEDLVRVVRFVAGRPCHPNFCLSIIRTRNLVDDPNPEIRATIAGYLGMMAHDLAIQPEAAEEILKGKLEKETDPRVLDALKRASEFIQRGKKNRSRVEGLQRK